MQKQAERVTIKVELIHFFPKIQTLGGVESILKLHLREDKAVGIISKGVFACEPKDLPLKIQVHNAVGLGIRGWHSLHRAAKLLAKEVKGCSHVVFHNLWGFRHVERLLPEEILRIGMIHVDGPVTREAIRNSAPHLDAILCVNESVAEFSRQFVSPDRVHSFCYPVAAPTRLVDITAARRIIGFSGRLVQEQKRIDRIPQIIGAIRDSGLEVDFEILGEGPALGFLQRNMPTGVNVRYLGRLSGANYWNALARWHSIFFCSDYEGTPISLLEALSQGVLPIYPRIQSGGESFVERVAKGLLYQSDSLGEPARILKNLAGLPPERISELRSNAIHSVSKNTPIEYLGSFHKACASAQRRDPVHLPTFRLLSHLPLGIVGRLSKSAAY